jgi:hypothetical protein
MKHGILAAAICLLLAGCAKRPQELQRAEKLDAECRGDGLAFSYPIQAPPGLLERAVKKHCYAPVGAWTDEADPGKGGTRKLVHDLRENGKQSLLCCKD